VAQRTEVRFIDDVDGSVGAETVLFGIDGKKLEIDLSEANAAKLRELFAPYMAAARRAGGSPGPTRPRTSSDVPKRDLSEVRSWLVVNGYPVKERGRISTEWLQAYEARVPASTTAQEVGSPVAPDQAAPADTKAVKFQAAS